MTNIAAQLEMIRQRMRIACERSGRLEQEVKLLLATKTVPAGLIAEALSLGETLIGENKVQELKQKFGDLTAYPHEAHFIGHLQTNKIKDVVKYAQCIQSVDRIDLVEKLDQYLLKEGKSLDIFVQVNTSAELSKFGVEPENALELIKKIARYDTFRVKGLMTIGLFSAETEQVRKCFKLLKEIQKKAFDAGYKNVEPLELSMGMSGDLEVAIEEGATIVRVGTAIFGQRKYSDQYYWNENK